MMKKRKEGFTLAELLVVVAIIAILVAVSIPIFTGRLEAAKEATCLANRRSLKAVMVNDYLSKESADMGDAFTTIYTEDQKKSKPEFVCPKEGRYTWEGNESSGHIKCSVHDGDGSDTEGEGGDVKNYFPGTTDLEVVEDYWPYASNAKVTAGGVFKAKDGNYYVVLRNDTIWSFTEPSAYKDSGIVVQLKKNVVDFIPNNKYEKGTVIRHNGDYYVVKNPTTLDASPNHSDTYKIPKTKL